jgi:hypothetical protein
MKKATNNQVNALVKFIDERMRILVKRKEGLPKPWTKDPILQRYRFCNVQREDDTVTQWIANNWRTPHASEPDLWFVMAVARWINWPDTLAAIGYPLPWFPGSVINALKKRKTAGHKVWTGAYMIGTQGNAIDKPQFIVRDVLDRAYLHREKLRPRQGDTLASFASRLLQQYAFKGFMAGQVIADVKYTGFLLDAADWFTWAASGPGSRRGLNRMCELGKDEAWREVDWLATLHDLQDRINGRFMVAPKLHAQDLQNCLCEFDKYERVRLGEGRPRSTYDGTSTSDLFKN